MGAGTLGGVDDLLAGGVRLAVSNVICHSTCFQPGFLQDHTQVAAQRIPRYGVNGVAVHLQGAAVDLVKAHQQVDQGGFAAAGGADQGNALAGLNAQVHVFNQGHIRHIAELDMLKLHTACTVGQGNGIGGIGQDGVFVNKVEHTLRTGQGVLQLGHNAGNIIERLGVLVGIVQQNRKLADRNAAANGNQRAHHADRRIHQRVDKAGGRVGDGGKEGGLYAADLQIGVDLVKALLGAAFVTEGADKMLVADQLVHQTGQLGAGLALYAEHIIGMLRNELCHKDGKRGENHNDQGNAPVNGKHKAQSAHNGQNAGEQLGKAHQQAVTELLHIGVDAADGVAGLVGIHIAQG